MTPQELIDKIAKTIAEEKDASIAVFKISHMLKPPQGAWPEEIDTEGYKKSGWLTVKRLKEHLAEVNYPDDALVLSQRVEDIYFERQGWEVKYKKGEAWHSILRFNEKMQEEIRLRSQGGESDYPMIDEPSDYIKEPDKELMEQYHPVWCPVKYLDDANLYLDLHY